MENSRPWTLTSMENSQIEALFQENNLPYKKVVENDFYMYELASESKHVKMKIMKFRNSERNCFSIIINDNGRYIDYECYKKSEEFLEDLLLILKSAVEMTSVIQRGVIIKNVFKFIYPKGSHTLETYTVTERISGGNLFHKKQYVTIVFAPWIE